ncbi:hypothetical protein M9H77_24869 [Catharanthus roseus]|uniref:Uncharacterized protein n=1 Tax=Catharanthus roseus TaxID=4058 RepID=A0ACC0A664_CATRO|nr:hypothetical protein M9H77_24869 [Catharanthus roseus]
MGSLMAGWDSHVEDPKLVKLKRNSSSLTKEEIEAFWRSRKLKEEEHLRDISALSPRTQLVTSKKNVFEDAERRFQKSISLPGSSTNKDEEMEALDMENNRAAFIQKNGWRL